MVITVTDVVKRALRLCGQTQAPGRGIADEQQTEGIDYLNQMLDGWNAVRSAIYTVRVDRYALTPSQTTYFIGPTGDFVAPRPISIDAANLVLVGMSPEAHIPLHLFTDLEWQNMVITEIPTTIPIGLYNDGASPDSQLYFWGYPTIANDLELFTRQALPNALTSADSLDLPEGYPRAIVYNLAVEMSVLYHKKANPLFSQVRQIATKARADLAAANYVRPVLTNDASWIGSQDTSWDEYSYLTRNQ